MTPQQAREKLNEYLEEQDELITALGRTSVRYAVTKKFMDYIKTHYQEKMSPLMTIATQDREQ